MKGNEKIFMQFMNNQDFQKEVVHKLLISIYNRINYTSGNPEEIMKFTSLLPKNS